MSGSGLHTSFALAAAMPVLVLVMQVWNVLARVLLVFQDALLTFISPQCRSGVVCGGLPRLDRGQTSRIYAHCLWQF
jgi:hypothetical protein